MKYFRAEEEPAARLPPNFITGFLEVSVCHTKSVGLLELMLMIIGPQLSKFNEM